ncbi:hypothetical protein PsYK624_138590 [Phanerochaete sordida]|uniref:Uncharacterized protein n=1 Tax=Phanerochaete sordida TaxID=48140 RepID=A0A9P3GKN4_9APHY|nr:hypothetical protein PsYK624_138590 [Phanerochaete sordida]
MSSYYTTGANTLDSGYPPVGFDAVSGYAAPTPYAQGPQPQYTSQVVQPGHLTVPGKTGYDLSPTVSSSSEATSNEQGCRGVPGQATVVKTKPRPRPTTGSGKPRSPEDGGGCCIVM